MTILVCHNHYAVRAGEDHAVGAESQLLRDYGHEVVTYVRDNREIGKWPWWRKVGLVMAGFYHPGVAREIRKLVTRVRPDVAHVHNVFPLLSPGIVKVLRAAGIPVVYTAHNFRCVCANGLLFRHGKVCHDCLHWRYAVCVRERCFRDSWWASLWYAAIIWWHRWRRTWQRHVTRVIALNHFSRGLLLQAGFAEKQLVVLPNFADEGYAIEVERKEAYVVFVGRLVEEKGVVTVLGAAELVPEVRVHIAGGGPLESMVRSTVSAKGLKNVTLLGHIEKEQLALVVAGALVLVFASLCYENCPLVVVNALWAGTPVVAARTGGVPEFVPEGRAGWHFTPGDSVELAERLKWVWTHRREVEGMRAQVRAWAREQFAPRVHAERLREIYAEAIAAVRRG
ncbi:MAG: glycosyltransferase family 4 protein [bacterium]|nr:glycosyltransferase family 4 protein [bacterium]